MDRYTLYDVIYRYANENKRETSVFTFDEFAGSLVREQWYNKYPHTVIIECNRIGD